MEDTKAELVVIDAPPDEVAARLRAGLLPMRSLWLPTPRELRAWDASSAALWGRWLGERRLLVGPRLFSPGAARFCPQLTVELQAQGHAQTRVTARYTLPRGAVVLVLVWLALLTVWLAVELPRTLDGGSIGWLPWWLLITASLVAAAAVALAQGGRALAEALPELVRVASDPGAAEDDW